MNQRVYNCTFILKHHPITDDMKCCFVISKRKGVSSNTKLFRCPRGVLHRVTILAERLRYFNGVKVGGGDRGPRMILGGERERGNTAPVFAFGRAGMHLSTP
jgi:hypothetical protein